MEHVVMNIDESVFRMPIYSVQANYIVMNIDESVFCIPIYSVQGRYNPDLWLDEANLNNGIVYIYKTIMNIDEPTMLLQGDIYALNSIQDQEIPRQILNFSLRTPPRQLRMRLLHNTELYRVNSDYPSAQALRYQNPTISVLCLLYMCMHRTKKQHQCLHS